MGRWIRFLLAIAIGAAGAWYYGWELQPVQFYDTTPETLRIDYKSDYVLMVAEVYQQDGDLEAAVQRMQLLGDQPADEIARQAVEFGVQAGYTELDLEMMRQLANDLATWDPDLETG